MNSNSMDCCRIYCVLLGTVVFIGCSNPEEVMLSSAERLSAAQQAIESGNNDEALRLLDEIVSEQPSVWSYTKRARLHADMGNDEAAIEDCKAGLELTPDARELKWLLGELKKAPNRRFKGRFASPPPKSGGR